MKKLNFHKTKYGKELLIDCLKISETKSFRLKNKPYSISFYEIIFVIKGTGTFVFDNLSIPYSSGTVLLLPPNRQREWTPTKETDAYVILFEGEFIERFFNDKLFVYRFHYFHNSNSPFYLYFDNKTLTKYLGKVIEIKNEIHDLKSDSDHLLRSLLYYLLIKLNREYEIQHKIKSDLFENIEVLKFIRLVEQNFTKIHRVQNYAELLGISKTYLNLKLKSFGKTASDIIKNRLLLEAKKELLYTDKSVSEISYKLSFSEPANFIRFFKKQTTLSPKQFRLEFSK